ncbi:MAG TPA: hypothetical protein VGJ15_12670 [Pirellulales bacterium]|jgi:hypothetical protein
MVAEAKPNNPPLNRPPVFARTGGGSPIQRKRVGEAGGDVGSGSAAGEGARDICGIFAAAVAAAEGAVGGALAETGAELSEKTVAAGEVAVVDGEGKALAGGGGDLNTSPLPASPAGGNDEGANSGAPLASTAEPMS